MNNLKRFCAFLLFFQLSACSFTPFLYKVDITQGSVFSAEQIARIQPGISRSEVRRILGSPSVSDPFHADRDVYIFSFKSGKEDRTYQRRLTVIYAGDQVATVNETPLTITD